MLRWSLARLWSVSIITTCLGATALEFWYSQRSWPEILSHLSTSRIKRRSIMESSQSELTLNLSCCKLAVSVDVTCSWTSCLSAFGEHAELLVVILAERFNWMNVRLRQSWKIYHGRKDMRSLPTAALTRWSNIHVDEDGQLINLANVKHQEMEPSLWFFLTVLLNM